MLEKKLKRFTSLLLVSGMILGLAACGSKAPAESEASSQEAASTGSTQASSEAAPEAAYPDYSKGFESKVTIQIPVFDRAFEGWNVADNYYTDWVQTEFGDKYNIDVEFVGIARSDQVNDYMQLLAAGTAPDIIFHYDMPQMLAYWSEECMQPLDLEEIAYYAPTYWANMSETIETYGKVDGEEYFVFADRPAVDSYINIIRQDWLDAVDMEVPTCLEELDAVLEAWKEAGLGHGGGFLIKNSFTYDYPYRDFHMSDEEHALYSDLAVAALPWKPTHDYLQHMNYYYNNGLMDTEFYLNTDNVSIEADFASGKAGITSFYCSSGSTIFDSVLANDPNAKFAYLPDSAFTSKDNVPQSRAYWPFGLIMGINQDVNDEERAAVWMYLEWLSQPENLTYFQYGVEGETYNVAENGINERVNDYVGECKLSQNNNKDYWCLITESATYEDANLNYVSYLMNYAPAGYEYILEENYADNKNNLQYSTPDALFTVIIDSLAEYKADLTTLWQELYVKCVMASEADFEATYESACQQYLDAGYQEILDEKQAAIDAGQYDVGGYNH